MPEMQTEVADWIEPEEEEVQFPVDYKITSTPNDFNVRTLFDFVKQGTVRIPGFQRNYVWDIKKASRLIESFIMGLPVPQLFFYEKTRNEFLVIDGQQRLMTVYYFIQGRFPRIEKRAELREIFDKQGAIPDSILNNDEFFDNFDLKLGKHFTGAENRLDGLNYQTLEDDDKTSFNLRPVRCVMIIQHDPRDNSSMYEIFNRLNTGGINLTPQEIRASMYYSRFYDTLSRANLDKRWRRLTRPEPDLHMRDMEILLRGFAMLSEGKTYTEPMIRFLNVFSEKSKKFSKEEIAYYESLFSSFLDSCEKLPDQAFSAGFGRFSTSMYEAIFTATSEKAFARHDTNMEIIDPSKLKELKADPEFLQALTSQTTRKKNVDLRLRRAREVLFGRIERLC